MNTENFRDDIQNLIGSGKITQLRLAQLSKIPQSTLSDFLRGKNKYLSSRHLFTLWPYVYGKEFPDKE